MNNKSDWLDEQIRQITNWNEGTIGKQYDHEETCLVLTEDTAKAIKTLIQDNYISREEHEQLVLEARQKEAIMQITGQEDPVEGGLALMVDVGLLTGDQIKRLEELGIKT